MSTRSSHSPGAPFDSYVAGLKRFADVLEAVSDYPDLLDFEGIPKVWESLHEVNGEVKAAQSAIEEDVAAKSELSKAISEFAKIISEFAKLKEEHEAIRKRFEGYQTHK